MEEIIKRKIITGYADRPLQDIYNFINGVQMENLITSKDAKSLMLWAEDYRYLFTEGKPKFLHADTLVSRKSFFIIWKHFHYIITDIDKVDKHFDPIPATYHISA